MRNETWSKIQLHENLELKNLMVIYALNLRKNLEHFLEFISYILYVIWKFRSPTLQTMCKSELKWRSYDHLKITAASWKVISKWFWNSTYDFEIQLMNWNPLRNDTNFEFTYCHFDVSPPVPRELRLRHFIHPKWTPHN